MAIINSLFKQHLKFCWAASEFNYIYKLKIEKKKKKKEEVNTPKFQNKLNIECHKDSNNLSFKLRKWIHRFFWCNGWLIINYITNNNIFEILKILKK
jgi:hypothetical protein